MVQDNISALPLDIKMNIMEFGVNEHIEISREDLYRYILYIDPTYTHVYLPVDLYKYRHLSVYELFRKMMVDGGWSIEFLEDGYKVESTYDQDIDDLFPSYTMDMYGESGIDNSMTVLVDNVQQAKRDLYTLSVLSHPRYDILTYRLEESGMYNNIHWMCRSEFFLGCPFKDDILAAYDAGMKPLSEIEDLLPHLEIVLQRRKKREELLRSPMYDLYQQIKECKWSIDLTGRSITITLTSERPVVFPSFINTDDLNITDGYHYEGELTVQDPYTVSIFDDLVLLAINDDSRNFNVDVTNFSI